MNAIQFVLGSIWKFQTFTMKNRLLISTVLFYVYNRDIPIDATSNNSDDLVRVLEKLRLPLL